MFNSNLEKILGTYFILVFLAKLGCAYFVKTISLKIVIVFESAHGDTHNIMQTFTLKFVTPYKAY